MKKLILLLILSIHPTYSQFHETKIIEYSDGSFGEYIDCLDDFGASSGKDILKTDNYQKEGEWESGKLNDCLIIIYNSTMPKMNVKTYYI